MDHGVAILQRGLEDALRRLQSRVDTGDQVEEPRGSRPGQSRHRQPRGQLEEHFDAPRARGARGVRQGAGLADRDCLVVQGQPGGVLEGNGSRAGARAHQDRHPGDQVIAHRLSQGLGGVGRADEQDELGAGHRLGGVVPGGEDRGEALEGTAGVDTAGLGHGRDVSREVRQVEQGHLVPVLGEVEGRRQPAIA
jgi:hypothetical protein